MREVTKEEFFKPIYDGGLDVHPEITTRFPYTSVWRFHRQIGRPVFGKTVDRLEGGLTKTAYFLADR